ncbi:Farnesyltranstransferase [Hippea maritima DSM 10411]|uniref:Farnesyltranstransferase n=2 Tax=Hippea TaxID=84404 RepID=F2LX95_HIPMA|nr:Farnesyltranstransferase [Hippea maritima DSM 10411]
MMSKLSHYKELVDNFINELAQIKRFPPIFQEALFYTPKSGGKRIRAMLVMCAADMFGADETKSLHIASAIELMHAYSLIHDDLPVMDNDDFRRGKPANHKVYGEDLALLVGDGLNTYTFNVIADAPIDDARKVKIVKWLSNNAGIGGMVVGQVVDVLSSRDRLKGHSHKKLVNFIHKHKTAKLIQASVVCGAICGNPDDVQLDRLAKYGLYAGVAFQIIDDYLDVVGDEEKLGKKKVDEINNTLTYPKVYGLKRSYDIAQKLKDMAILQIKDIKGSKELIDIAKLIVERDR